jgi:hypothetical protein
MEYHINMVQSLFKKPVIHSYFNSIGSQRFSNGLVYSFASKSQLLHWDQY